MNIKKVDDKPMVIHTKEKAKLRMRQEPEAKIKGRNVLVVEKDPKIIRTDNKEVKPDGKKTTMKGKSNAKESVRQAEQKENGIYAQMQRTKQDSKKAVSKKNSTVRTLSAPAESAANAGRRLYHSQAARTKAKKIKKVQAGKKIGKKMVRDSATETAQYKAKKQDYLYFGKKILKKNKLSGDDVKNMIKYQTYLF